MLNNLLRTVIATECERLGVPRKLVNVIANRSVKGVIESQQYRSSNGEIHYLIIFGHDFVERISKHDGMKFVMDELNKAIAKVRVMYKNRETLEVTRELSERAKMIRTLAQRKDFKRIEITLTATHRKTGIVVSATGSRDDWALSKQWDMILASYATIVAQLAEGKEQKI